MRVDGIEAGRRHDSGNYHRRAAALSLEALARSGLNLATRYG